MARRTHNSCHYVWSSTKTHEHTANHLVPNSGNHASSYMNYDACALYINTVLCPLPVLFIETLSDTWYVDEPAGYVYTMTKNTKVEGLRFGTVRGKYKLFVMGRALNSGAV